MFHGLPFPPEWSRNIGLKNDKKSDNVSLVALQEVEVCLSIGDLICQSRKVCINFDLYVGHYITIDNIHQVLNFWKKSGSIHGKI